MSNITVIQPKEQSLAVNQLALFIDSSTVQAAKVVSKDLLTDIAESYKRMKKVSAKNPDLKVTKEFKKVPLPTFKFICNQYKIKSTYLWGCFQACIFVADSLNSFIYLESERVDLQIEEIETVKTK